MLLNLIAFAANLALAVKLGVPAGRFLVGGDPVAIEKAGGVTAPDLIRDEWWRLVTAAFLHYGLFHLISTLLSLYFLRRTEALWGSGRFAVLYLMAGAGGMAGALIYDPGALPNPPPLAGASGAVCGVLAALGAWLLLNKEHLPPQDVRQKTQEFVFISLLTVATSLLPGVSWPAHLGGALIGFVTAYLLHVHRHGTPGRKAVATLQLALMPLIFVFGVGAVAEQDPRWRRFVKQEERKQAKADFAEFKKFAVGLVDPVAKEFDDLNKKLPAGPAADDRKDFKPQLGEVRGRAADAAAKLRERDDAPDAAARLRDAGLAPGGRRRGVRRRPRRQGRRPRPPLRPEAVDRRRDALGSREEVADLTGSAALRVAASRSRGRHPFERLAGADTRSAERRVGVH